MSYVEHCCCERQLPSLLRAHGTAMFQTSGDVLIKHLMKSVGCMVSNGSTMWLMAERVDIPFLKTVRHWFARGWVTELWLLTKEDCSETVNAELCPAAKPQGTVAYAHDGALCGGFLGFSDGKKTVAIQGDMLLEVKPGMKMYAGCFGDANSDSVKNVMDAVVALTKARCGMTIEEAPDGVQQQTEQTDASHEPQETEQVEKEESEKRKRNRKEKESVQ